MSSVSPPTAINLAFSLGLDDGMEMSREPLGIASQHQTCLAPFLNSSKQFTYIYPKLLMKHVMFKHRLIAYFMCTRVNTKYWLFFPTYNSMLS